VLAPPVSSATWHVTGIALWLECAESSFCRFLPSDPCAVVDHDYNVAVGMLQAGIGQMILLTLLPY
jgi:hypothetical protein